MAELTLVTDETSARTLYVSDFGLHIDPKHEYLLDLVATELADPKFENKLHGTLRIRNLGCDGPLCKRAMRLWGRKYRAAQILQKVELGQENPLRKKSPGRPRNDDTEYLLHAIQTYHEGYLNETLYQAA